MKNLLINNNGSTTQLSTTIFCTMRRRHITMSLVNLSHELDTFTTRVKTKTIPALGYSTSIMIVQHKSLRRTFIPCHQLILVFYFLLYLCSSFLLHELDRKSDQKNQMFEKFLCCEYGLGGHGELANDWYNRQIGLKLLSTWAQFMYKS